MTYTCKTDPNENKIAQHSTAQCRKVSAPKEITDTQLNYLKNIIETLMSSIPTPTEEPTKVLELEIKKWGTQSGNRDQLSLKEVSAADTLSAIKQLGNRSVFSHNSINAISLKAAKDILAAPIAHLANLSIKKSKFASSWKQTWLIPLHKGKGMSQANLKYYRPVAILPTISKIVEKVIHIQILNCMETNKQFSHNHHGYRNHFSTSTALLQLSDSIIQATDSNLISTLVIVNKSAAFNCVDFKILDSKL